MKYLFFNTTMKAYIPSDITDHLEARKLFLKLIELFPSGDWDYSNAIWTVNYLNQLNKLI